MPFAAIRATRVFDSPRVRPLCQRCGIEIEPKVGRPGIHCRDCYEVLKPIGKKMAARLARLQDGWEDLADAS